MATAQVSATDVLFSRAAPTERSFRNRIIGIIALEGIGLDVLALPLALSTAALAGARFNDPLLLPLLVATFLGCGVAMMINDIIDIEKDKTKWPLKPLATGLISKSEAIFCAAIFTGIAVVIAIVYFNWIFLALGLLVLVLNYIYSRYTRNNIGGLTLLLPMAIVPATLWSAISPETVLTPLPWLLIIFIAAHTASSSLVIEALDPKTPALFIRLRPNTERALYVVSVIVMFLFGVAIYVYEQLSWLLVVVLIVLTAWLLTPAKNLGDNRSRELLESTFKMLTSFYAIYWLSIAAFVWIK